MTPAMAEVRRCASAAVWGERGGYVRHRKLQKSRFDHHFAGELPDVQTHFHVGRLAKAHKPQWKCSKGTLQKRAVRRARQEPGCQGSDAGRAWRRVRCRRGNGCPSPGRRRRAAFRQIAGCAKIRRLLIGIAHKRYLPDAAHSTHQGMPVSLRFYVYDAGPLPRSRWSRPVLALSAISTSPLMFASLSARCAFGSLSSVSASYRRRITTDNSTGSASLNATIFG